MSQQQIFNQETKRLIFHFLSKMFIKIQPLKFPAFAFAWLELISDKQFMPHFIALKDPQDIMTSGQRDKYFDYKDIIEALYNFLKENMSPTQKSSPALTRFYKATVMVTLMMRNDYPDFLSSFHFSFVNALPAHCI
jgi:CCR4-NOT transcription complex subunit 1